MGEEIERKFLVEGDGWRPDVARSMRMRQGYLTSSPSASAEAGGRSSVRVRVSGDRAWLNIKGATLGVRRREYEYGIPSEDAAEMLEYLCEGPLIEKIRHEVPVGDHVWEVDVFEGDNAGLVVAEVELGSPDELFVRPPWAGKEVSDDPRYYNVSLVRHPYREWK